MSLLLRSGVEVPNPLWKNERSRECVSSPNHLLFEFPFVHSSSFLRYMFPSYYSKFFWKKKKNGQSLKWKRTVSCPTCPQLAVLQAVHLQLFQLFLLLFSSKSINNLQNQFQKNKATNTTSNPSESTGLHGSSHQPPGWQNIHSLEHLQALGCGEEREHIIAWLCRFTSCHFLSHVIGWIIHKPCQQFCYQLGKRKARIVDE